MSESVKIKRYTGRLLGPGLSWISMTYVVPGILIIIYSFLSPRLGGGVIWDFNLDAWAEVIAKGSRSEAGWGTVGDASLLGIIAAAIVAIPVLAWSRSMGRSDRRALALCGVFGLLAALNHLASAYNNYSAVFVRSVVWSLWATALCAVLALPLVVFISSRTSRVVKNALLVAVMIPFWTSMLVRTYAIRFLLSNTGPLNNIIESFGLERQAFLNTRFAVMFGLVYTALPFMILPLFAAVERSDRAQLEAARDLGARPMRVFSEVFVPMIRPGLVVGSTMVFVLSVAQYLVPTLLGGGKTNMIANLLELQFGEAFNWPLGAAIAAVFSLLTILSLYVVTGRNEEMDLL